MIGRLVQYKTGDDKKIYVVVDYFAATHKYEAEVCILVDFPFYPKLIRQLRIWQKLSLFNIIAE